jgi:paraquat-inducible protein B
LEGRTRAVSLENHVFPLFADRDTAQAASYTRKIQVISYFLGSVSGLGVGSPVTMHGIAVGHVTNVRLAYDRTTDTVSAPVRYEIEPERVVGVGVRVFKTDAESVEALLKQGLRATLQSASLITGQQEVALDFVPDAPPAQLSQEDGYFVLPTTPGGGFAGLTAAAGALLDKVNQIPFDQLGKNLGGILKSVNDLASGPEARKALTELGATISTLEQLTKHVDAGAAPALKQLPEMTAQLQKTVTNANKLLLSLDSGYGDNTKFNRDLERLLVQTNDALNSIRALADLLSRHPEALIKGRPAGGLE